LYIAVTVAIMFIICVNELNWVQELKTVREVKDFVISRTICRYIDFFTRIWNRTVEWNLLRV